MTNTINITLDLDNLSRAKGYDEDGEPIALSLEDAVIEECAKQLRASLERQVSSSARIEQIRNVTNEEIRSLVRPILEGVLDGDVFYRTDTYGYSTGDAKSLREHVVEEAKKLLKTTGQNRSTSRDSIHAYVDGRIKELVKEELGAELDELRAAVKTQLAGGIASLLADALPAGAKKR